MVVIAASYRGFSKILEKLCLLGDLIRCQVIDKQQSIMVGVLELSLYTPVLSSFARVVQWSYRHACFLFAL